MKFSASPTIGSHSTGGAGESPPGPVTIRSRRQPVNPPPFPPLLVEISKTEELPKFNAPVFTV